MNHLEIEYKLLIDKKTYKKLMNYYSGQLYTQTNYYFTSPTLDKHHYALRVRKKYNQYEMTLKVPMNKHRYEYNEIISEDIFHLLMKGQFPNNSITQELMHLNVNIDEIKYLTSLKTKRKDILFDEGILSIDKNWYRHHIDYELEFEVNNPDSGYPVFLAILNNHHLELKLNPISKLKRAKDSL